jgi:hypothetical protein
VISESDSFLGGCSLHVILVGEEKVSFVLVLLFGYVRKKRESKWKICLCCLLNNESKCECEWGVGWFCSLMTCDPNTNLAKQKTSHILTLPLK